MQTFLPYPDFTGSAQTLDPKRLGKQRVETIQVLRGLIQPGYGWRHHPAVKMWQGYEEALVRYGLDICAAWTATGRADTCATTLLTDLRTATGITEIRTAAELSAAGDMPPWLGDDPLHESHRSALLRKDPAHYRPLFGPTLPDDLPYVWPPATRPKPPATTKPRQPETQNTPPTTA
ncbi:MSMEG_6728 family protein [Actinoplanes sp. CA-015351]|uniref:MSMEG_6728 family protein n=1 Tax=Actinoplanes sp. CA-015351 TaxID=3239897 RepID=UPI003D9687DE